MPTLLGKCNLARTHKNNVDAFLPTLGCDFLSVAPEFASHIELVLLPVGPIPLEISLHATISATVFHPAWMARCRISRVKNPAHSSKVCGCFSIGLPPPAS
jgi:hypothetical protein